MTQIGDAAAVQVGPMNWNDLPKTLLRHRWTVTALTYDPSELSTGPGYLGRAKAAASGAGCEPIDLVRVRR